MANHVITNEAPQELNAQLNLWSYDENGNKYINFDADTEAARQYFLQEVNSSTRFFYSLKEKLEFLFANLYYEPCLLYTSPSPRDVEESRMPSSA